MIRALLRAEPERVVVINDLSNSYERNLSKDPRVYLFEGSILDGEGIKRTVGWMRGY